MLPMLLAGKRMQAMPCVGITAIADSSEQHPEAFVQPS